jgi:NADH dehydrogenase
MGTDGKPLPGVAPVAMQEGRYVAEQIGRKLRSRTPLGPFQYRDKGNVATIGRAKAVAELGRLRLKGWPAWIAWILVHIYYLIGFRNRVLVLMEWAWLYFTFQHGARLIVGNPESIGPFSRAQSLRNQETKPPSKPESRS